MSAILDNKTTEPDLPQPELEPEANLESSQESPELPKEEEEEQKEEEAVEESIPVPIHPDLEDLDVEEIALQTQELLRRGTAFEFVRTKSKAPAVLEESMMVSVMVEEEAPKIEAKVREPDVQMIMKESNLKSAEDFSIDSWRDLQGILKNNLIIAKDESKIEEKLMKKLEKRIKKNSHLRLEILEKNRLIRSEKYDCDEKAVKTFMENPEEIFKEEYPLIKEFLGTLHDNPRILALLSKNKENLKPLEETLTQSFYENNLAEDQSDSEIFRLFAELLKFELENPTFNQADSPMSKAWAGKQDGFFSRLWTAYLNKGEYKEYIRTVIQGPLMAFVKENVEMNFDVKVINEEILKKKQDQQEQQDSKRKASQEVMINLEKNEQLDELGITSFLSPSHNSVPSLPEVKEYSEVEVPKMRLKNSKAIEKEVVKAEGVVETQEETEEEARMRVSTLFEFAEYEYQSPLTRVKDEEVVSVMRKRFQVLKQHLNILIKSIFENLELMPMNVRILCRIIYDVIKQKFPSWPEKDYIKILYNYLFAKWIIPHYITPGKKGILDCYEESNEIVESLVTFAKVVKEVFTVNLYDPKDYFSELNEYITEIAPSIEIYFRELIAVNDESIKEVIEGKSELSGDLKAKSIWMSAEEVETLCKLITKERSELRWQFPKVIELAEKILIMGEERKVAEAEAAKEAAKTASPGRSKDRKESKEVKPVEPEPPKQLLFSYVELPVRPVNDYKKHFDQALNFPKHITDEERLVMRTKHILKNFLIAIPRITNLRRWEGVKNMIISHVLDKYCETSFIFDSNQLRRNNNNIISPQLNANFLKLLFSKLPKSYQANNYFQLYQEIYQDMKTLSDAVFTSISRVKYQISEALGTIKEKNIFLANLSAERDLMLKKLKIRSQIKNIELPICTSNPLAIRAELEKNIILDQNKLQTLQEFQEKIKIHQKPGVEDPCVHSKIEIMKDENGGGVGYAVLERLKSWTPLGYISQPATSKCIIENVASHTKTIDEFMAYFSKLEEVQEMIETGEDQYGVNEAMTVVYELAVTEIKKLYPKILKQEEKIIKEEIENYICRKLYYNSFIHFGNDQQILKADRAFWKLCKLHQWINFDQLEIPERGRHPEMWAFMAKELRKIDSQITAVEKLERVTNCILMIAQTLELNANKKASSGADDILPILIYVLLKANSQRMASNLNYIKLARDQQDMQESNGYTFILLSSAFVVIQSINHRFLRMSLEEYTEMYDKHRQKLIKQRKLSC